MWGSVLIEEAAPHGLNHNARGNGNTLRALLKTAPYAPLLPIASTGQPSMASLHCFSSSSFSGCL